MHGVHHQSGIFSSGRRKQHVFCNLDNYGCGINGILKIIKDMTAKQIQTGRGMLPFSWGMAALTRFCEENNLTLNDFAQLEKEMRPTLLLSLIWHGFKDGHRKERKDFDLTVDDIADLIDESEGLMERCMEAVANSMPGGQGNGNKAKAKRA
jgi:hypothetical protein